MWRPEGASISCFGGGEMCFGKAPGVVSGRLDGGFSELW